MENNNLLGDPRKKALLLSDKIKNILLSHGMERECQEFDKQIRNSDDLGDMTYIISKMFKFCNELEQERRLTFVIDEIEWKISSILFKNLKFIDRNRIYISGILYIMSQMKNRSFMNHKENIEKRTHTFHPGSIIEYIILDTKKKHLLLLNNKNDYTNVKKIGQYDDNLMLNFSLPLKNSGYVINANRAKITFLHHNYDYSYDYQAASIEIANDCVTIEEE
jgi:hypothetical protein